MTEEASQEVVAEIAQEARSSIELSRDAKGVYRWSLKRYYDPSTVGGWGEAVYELKMINVALVEQYA